ncbi:MAG: CRTAC1 family protein [Armatimonadetes bacterium]|nr:CRTAC1 family protein [Armatimonadota bacterium]
MYLKRRRFLGLLSLLVLGCQTSQPPTTAHPAASSPVRFVEVAEKAGLKFSWTAPGKRPLNILQTIGNGCAFLDYDGDSNLDILLVGPKPGLFRGDGKGQFTDVSATVLGTLSGYFLGVAVGDYDGDGFADIYLSGYREGRLLHNEAGKSFNDVTALSGLKPQPWGTACGFSDLNGDGKLDLYVANYAEFGPTTEPQLCKFRTEKHGELLSSCGPTRYIGLKGTLWQGDGKRFTEITQAAGLSTQNGRGLGVAFADIHGKGFPSIALANDEAPGDFFSARGGGKFENIGQAAGVATDLEGKVHGGMGIDWGDYDNDGKLDLFVATFRNEVKNLYHNDGDEAFSDKSNAVGIGQAALPYVSFGCKFLDADNDGWLDLMITNGHVQDNIELIEDTTYRQKTLLLHSQKGVFTDVGASSGIASLPPIVGRGLAVGDYDNDGHMDVLIVDSEGKPLLLNNQSAPQGWVGFDCGGRYGAILTLKLTSGEIRVRQCQSAGSYLSASDARVHFGLGKDSVESLTVKWPSGKSETWKGFTTGKYLTLQPGQAPH